MTLEKMIEAAEAGDTALWEDIAKLLMKARKKPVKRKTKNNGPYIWSLVTFADGVQMVMGGYGIEADDEIAREKAHYRRASIMSGRWFDSAWLDIIPAVVSATAPEDVGLTVDEAIERCLRQRIEGWGKDCVFTERGCLK